MESVQNKLGRSAHSAGPSRDLAFASLFVLFFFFLCACFPQWFDGLVVLWIGGKCLRVCAASLGIRGWTQDSVEPLFRVHSL